MSEQSGTYARGRELIGIDLHHHDQSTTKLQTDAIASLGDFGTKNFNTIDKNQNGYISFAEINDVIANPSKHGPGDSQELTSLTTIKDNFPKIAEVSNDEFGAETEISKADFELLRRNPALAKEVLKKSSGPNWSFDQMSEIMDRSAKPVEGETKEQQTERLEKLAYASLFDIAGFASRSFAKLDTDENGFINKEELESAKSKVNSSDPAGLKEKAQLSNLIVNYDQLRKSSNDEWGFESSGISRLDLRHQNWMEGNRFLPPYIWLKPAKPEDLR